MFFLLMVAGAVVLPFVGLGILLSGSKFCASNRVKLASGLGTLFLGVAFVYVLFFVMI